MHEVGLTPVLLTSDRDSDLPRFGIGLTDIAKLKAGTDDTLTEEDFDVAGFRVQIKAHAPRLVCFNGKKAAKIALGRDQIDYGLQQERIGASLIFVAPSTSGAARGYWDIRYWHEVARLSQEAES